MLEEFNEFLQKYIDEELFPGCSYAIVVGREVLYGYLGHTDYSKKVKVDSNSLYDIASITKLLVTITLISFLIEDGRVKLDEYVYKYLPKFDNKEIKVLHLLTHSSGLNANYERDTFKDVSEFYNFSIDYKPGEDITYRDINFILLGFIVEKVYGKKIDILARELIFDKLDMKDTMFNPENRNRCVPTENDKYGLICGTVEDWKAQMLDGVAGHAGVFSNALDIAKYLEMVLSDGRHKGCNYIDKTLIDMWFTPLFLGSDNVRRTIGWIYGPTYFICNDFCSSDTIAHTGYPGNHIFIDRGNDLAFIFLSNSVYPKGLRTDIVRKRQDINNELYRLLKKYDYIY